MEGLGGGAKPFCTPQRAFFPSSSSPCNGARARVGSGRSTEGTPHPFPFYFSISPQALRSG